MSYLGKLAWLRLGFGLLAALAFSSCGFSWTDTTLDQYDYTLPCNGSVELSGTNFKSKTWTSDNYWVANISGGQLNSLFAGETTITAPGCASPVHVTVRPTYSMTVIPPFHFGCNANTIKDRNYGKYTFLTQTTTSVSFSYGSGSNQVTIGYLFDNGLCNQVVVLYDYDYYLPSLMNALDERFYQISYEVENRDILAYYVSLSGDGKLHKDMSHSAFPDKYAWIDYTVMFSYRDGRPGVSYIDMDSEDYYELSQENIRLTDQLMHRLESDKAYSHRIEDLP